MNSLPSCPPYLPSYLPPYPLQLPPSISPLFYTNIHPPPTFFPIPMPPFILYTSPAPLPLIFAFLNHFLAIPLLPAPSPTITHLLPLFPNALYPLPDPSYPPAPACSPSPHFRFLTDLWTLFGMYFCSNLSIHVHT